MALSKVKDDTCILSHVGGQDRNNLNNLLQSFVDSNDEIPTFAESPYIAVDDLQSVLGANDNKFSVLTLNIQSLNAKFDNLCAFFIIYE